VDDNGNWAVIARNPHGEMSQFFTFAAQMLPKFESRYESWVPGGKSKLYRK
jgi:hypothetical protein